MLKSKLKVIVDERGLSIREVARGTGINFEVVRRVYNDTMERYPRDVLDKLCKYLNVTVQDILEFTPEDEETPPV
ncbi:helix-turn-helix transcriptional regulator [Paenibacillus sp. FSL R7-0048]|uniref:helix-turn-helix domain-containing protein n=1 Tax=Paenibacillus TaxID=44249 RepID=UPI00096CEDFB|nr:helix-turn-helix transcriptional regulator [Paenibacillus odorifer]OMD87853.1 hypothetical protein BSK53_02370 [Paenibacillus odorifer]